MNTKHYKLIKDIINLSFPFLYSIFIFNQFIYHNSNSYKVTFLDFTYFYLFIFVIFLLFYFVFIKKKSEILYRYFLIINLILIFLLISSLYKYFEINLIFKIV